MIELSTYSLEVLRSDKELNLYRGKSEYDDSQILVLSPAAEYPAPEVLKQLEHEYSLREELDPAWAARPIGITHHRDRTVLVLEDPGGVPLDQLLGPARNASPARIATRSVAGGRSDAGGQPLDLVLALRLAVDLSGVIDRLHERGIITIPVAIGSLLWGYLYSGNVSPINFVIDHLHLQKVDFLAPNLLVGAIANVVNWAWTGYNMVGIYTALQGIPRDLYEAAKIDGAGRLAVIRHIKLPLVMPAVRVVLLFAVIGTSQIFGEPFILRSLGYVPENITPNLYIYWIAQRDANYSYSAALAVILAVIVFAITLLMFRRPVKQSRAPIRVSWIHVPERTGVRSCSPGFSNGRFSGSLYYTRSSLSGGLWPPRRRITRRSFRLLVSSLVNRLTSWKTGTG